MSDEMNSKIWVLNGKLETFRVEQAERQKKNENAIALLEAQGKALLVNYDSLSKRLETGMALLEHYLKAVDANIPRSNPNCMKGNYQSAFSAATLGLGAVISSATELAKAIPKDPSGTNATHPLKPYSIFSLEKPKAAGWYEVIDAYGFIGFKRGEEGIVGVNKSLFKWWGNITKKWYNSDDPHILDDYWSGTAIYYRKSVSPPDSYMAKEEKEEGGFVTDNRLHASTMPGITSKVNASRTAVNVEKEGKPYFTISPSDSLYSHPLYPGKKLMIVRILDTVDEFMIQTSANAFWRVPVGEFILDIMNERVKVISPESEKRKQRYIVNLPSGAKVYPTQNHNLIPWPKTVKLKIGQIWKSLNYRYEIRGFGTNHIILNVTPNRGLIEYEIKEFREWVDKGIIELITQQ